MNSTTDLVINVIDIPDTAPFFTNLPYVEEVDEGITRGTHVITVTAVDGDRGINNPVSYSFYDGVESYQFFDIDANTGEITVGVDELDREDPDILDMYGVLEFMVMVRGYVAVFKRHRCGIL